MASASLGSYLRGQRERRGLSLEEMARATRVATRYLEGLEAEDFRSLPAPVFTKGFIRAYCQVLGIDAEEALVRYHQQTGEAPAASSRGPQPERELPAQSRNRGTVLVSFVLLVILGGALFAVTLALQSGREDRRARQSQAETQPSAAARSGPATSATPAVPPAVQGTTSATPPPAAPAAVVASPAAPPPKEAAAPAETRPAPAERAPETAAAPPSAVASVSAIAAAVGTVPSPYRLVARALEPTWVRVRMEDGRAIEETIPAGGVREWVSSAPFVLTVGNAGGITLELNGRALPPLGARGVVISRLVIPPAQQ